MRKNHKRLREGWRATSSFWFQVSVAVAGIVSKDDDDDLVDFTSIHAITLNASCRSES